MVKLYSDENHFTENRGFRILKRKSCDGCRSCSWMLDKLHEFYANEEAIGNLQKIENKKLYEIVCVELSRDFETSYVDNYHFELKDKEENNE